MRNIALSLRKSQIFLLKKIIALAIWNSIAQIMLIENNSYVHRR